MKYIYGIIDSNTENSFGPCLPTDLSSEALAKEEASAQVGRITTCEEVYTISYQDISAVVSDSQFVDYTTFPKNQVARYLLRHQQVIEKIIDTYTIIPMRMGTYALNKEEVEEILSKGYKTFKDIFKKVVNKIEVDVVATWSDFSSVLREVSEEGEIKEFKQTILNKKEGITVDDQIKIGVMVNNHLNEKREKYAFEIQTSLVEAGEGIKVHELMNDKMVVNTAFL
ncbi:MAG: GvpL/GvpF family gas vesicle protein, partial [Candidatus Roizmanbacteria bacterium]|nr:GvpL/GvpF family gas vesicle protein [Candidatus Roizmanbacteria bacterium]